MERTRTAFWIVLICVAAVASACTTARASVPSAAGAPAGAQTPAATTVPLSDLALDEATLVVKQLDGSQSHWLMPVDPRDGVALKGYDAIDMGVNFYNRLTPDRRTLVIVSYPPGSYADASLRFLELDSWSESTALRLPTDGWTSAMAISPNGALLAFATVETRESSVWLVDLASRIVLKRLPSTGHVAKMEFTADNEMLMLYVQRENTQTGLSEGAPVGELRSARDLEVLWTQPLEDVRDGFEPIEAGKGHPHEPGTGRTYRPAVVFHARSGNMFIVHADGERLTRVDFAARTLLTQSIQPQLSWFERLLALGASTAHAKVQDGIIRDAVISADGEVVFTAGLENKLTPDSRSGWQLEQTHLPVRAIRLRDAVELFRSEATGDTLRLANGDTTLLAVRWDASTGQASGTSFVSVTDGAVLGEVNGIPMEPSTRIGGSPLLVATSFDGTGRGKTTLSAFDLDALPLGTWSTPRFGAWVILP